MIATISYMMGVLKIAVVLTAAGFLTDSVGIVGAQDSNSTPNSESQPPLQLEPQADNSDASRNLSVPAEKSESAAEIDRLFAKLAVAPNKEAAESIASQILTLSVNSGSDTIALLMTRASKAMERKDLPLAMDFLDAVVRLKPNYAEGWNLRATVLFLQEKYEHSIKDIEKTLALEPRHWGALSGLAAILARLDRPEDAVQIYQRVLEIYPLLESARLAMEAIEQELLGEGI